MRVSHYFEWEETITGGQKQSVKNQRKILKQNDVQYTTEPDLSADILHLNNMGPRSTYLARKARNKDIKVVVHAHQTAEDFKNSFKFSNVISKPLKPYLKYAYSLADHIICPSGYNREVMDNYTDASKTVISNGFDPEKLEGFEDLRGEYLEKYDLKPPVVFNVGHVIKRKGLETFIETAREMPETDFVWFGFLNPTGGEGFTDELLKSRDTKKLVENSPDNCQFTGYVDDVRGAFAAGDIFFFPSKNENEGMALLEAMSCSKPLVVRDISVYKWLEDGENCLKAENDFTSQIEKLKDEGLRSKIGSNAEDRSREFELDSVGDDLVSLYKELV
ncbi:glycosyltransferase family 4 protein [Candidatus Nanohalobium constans]|uniref:Glycosyl transferase group 1 n=1 Tax=Candidatus Nanohalobium constans TaxID=2565781 RepID=A0A5Q0UFK4_9ARCH|nr:glycosyltransferase family 4 protein [Candidatus Nanohalobium constans]QGA80151.1 glycosyl transferase group 1 [Candidatus Nanohalobium constans]